MDDAVCGVSWDSDPVSRSLTSCTGPVYVSKKKKKKKNNNDKKKNTVFEGVAPMGVAHSRCLSTVRTLKASVENQVTAGLGL